MQRLLRNGKSHDTSVESKKRSYKKPLKVATQQATVLDTVMCMNMCDFFIFYFF
jgi:hypothetical protein